MADLWGYEHVLDREYSQPRVRKWWEAIPGVADAASRGIVGYMNSKQERDAAAAKLKSEQDIAGMREAGENARAQAMQALREREVGVHENRLADDRAKALSEQNMGPARNLIDELDNPGLKDAYELDPMRAQVRGWMGSPELRSSGMVTAPTAQTPDQAFDGIQPEPQRIPISRAMEMAAGPLAQARKDYASRKENETRGMLGLKASSRPDPFALARFKAGLAAEAEADRAGTINTPEQGFALGLDLPGVKETWEQSSSQKRERAQSRADKYLGRQPAAAPKSAPKPAPAKVPPGDEALIRESFRRRQGRDATPEEVAFIYSQKLANQ